MRIVHITPYYLPAWNYGGPVRVAQALCEGLAARGHTLTVVTTDARDASGRAGPAEETLSSVRIVRIPNLSNRLAWRRAFLPMGAKHRLLEALRRADIAHVHEARSMLHLAALPILRRMSVPYVLTAHGSLPHHAQRGLIKRMYDGLGGRAVLDRACRLHAVSELEATQYVETRADPQRIVIIPNGIDPKEYVSLPDGLGFREELGLAPDTPLVLFLSRLHAIKGVNFLIEAFARLHERLPDAVLALVGPDDGAAESARRQVASLGLGDSVRFILGMMGPKKFDAYRAADAYVLPSRFDVFSIGLVEAMASGAPAIVSHGCGLAAQVAKRDAGSVVDYGDVAGLCDALLTTLTDSDTARLRAERARAWVLETYGWERIIDAMENLYADCVEGA
jgi:glycosyltransferase involved in cell wall biosynthesis